MMIDLREYVEYATGHIVGAKLTPMRSLVESSKEWDKSEVLVLVCKSGRRAEWACGQLMERGFAAVSILPGGMDAWRKAGKPIEKVNDQPWAMDRQLRIAAGSLIVTTLALSFLKSRYFLLGTAFVGAGLVYAGVSDTCMMASGLARMPWNRLPRQT